MNIKSIYLILEFTLLFFGIPLFLFFDRSLIHPSAILLPVLLGVLLLLRFRTDFKWKELVQFTVSKNEWLNALTILVVSFSVMLVYVLLFEPDKLFNLPKGNVPIWLLLCVFYPVFSAYAQEVLYRLFLAKRYSSFLKSKQVYILLSGISFSFVHILYYSHVSIILTFIAGLYLSSVYLRTKSVVFTSILHGALGNLVFTVGLGDYFWLDMQQWIQ